MERKYGVSIQKLKELKDFQVSNREKNYSYSIKKYEDEVTTGIGKLVKEAKEAMDVTSNHIGLVDVITQSRRQANESMSKYTVAVFKDMLMLKPPDSNYIIAYGFKDVSRITVVENDVKVKLMKNRSTYKSFTLKFNDDQCRKFMDLLPPESQALVKFSSKNEEEEYQFPEEFDFETVLLC